MISYQVKNRISQINTSNTVLNIDVMQKNYLNYVLTYNSYDTYCCYLGHLKIIVDFLKEKYNVIYDCDVIDDYLYEFIQYQRKKELSYATINKRIYVFKRMYHYNNSIINFDHIKCLKEMYTTYNYLENNQIFKLVDYVKNSSLTLQNKLMIMLFLESGVRRKELRYIEVANIDLSNDIILLTVTKTKKPRIICFNDYTKLYLYDFLKVIGKRKYLFDLSNTAIQSCFRRIKKTLDLDNFSCYVLRHSYATVIVNNDGNMEMLRQTMGHVKLTTTQRYLHYNKKLISCAYKKAFEIKKD